MTDDLTAAVARLRNLQPVLDGDTDMSEVRNDDVRLVLAALEAVQADASDAFLRGYNRGLRHAEERAVAQSSPLDHQQPCIERGRPNPSLMPKSEYCAYHARREPQQSAATPSPTTEFVGTIGAAQAATDGPAADPLSHAWKSGYAQAKEESALEQQFCPHCNPCCGDGNDKCRKPAADPIADLARRLRALRIVDEVHSDNPLGRDAADALERLRAELDDVRAMLQNTNHDAARLAALVDKYKWQVRDTCTRAERAEAERDTLAAIVRAAYVLRDLVGNDCIIDGDAWNERANAIQVLDAARAARKGEA